MYQPATPQGYTKKDYNSIFSPYKSHKPLDSLIQSYQLPVQHAYRSQMKIIRSQEYATNIHSESLYSSDMNKDHHSDQSYNSIQYDDNAQVHNSFLLPGRPFQRFIGDAAEIITGVQKTFRKAAGWSLPEDIIVEIIDQRRQMQFSAHLQKPEILGFAVNTDTLKQVFVKKNPLDILFITMGHELGHVAGPRIDSDVEEEAKAFAFEVAWIQAVVKDNILGLAKSIDMSTLKPASNGIHDTAFEFVRIKIAEGMNPMDIFHALCDRTLIIKKTIDLLV